MDFKQLRYFLGVVEAKSITKAAEIFHVAQPAIGMQIRKLEDELGVKLLVRHARGVMPTEAGEELAKEAGRLLLDLERTRQNIMDIGGEPRGRVTVGMTTAAMQALASALLKACRQKYPAIMLNFSEGMSERVSEWVVQDRLDIALSYRRPDESSLVAEALAVESLHFAVPGGHPLACVSEITLREALEYDLILTSRRSLFRIMMEEAASTNRLALRIVCEADSPAMIREFVHSNMGCSIVPYCGVRPEVESGSIATLRIVDPEIERVLYLTYLKKRQGSRALEAVCGEIRRIVDELIESGSVGWTHPGEKPVTSSD